MVPQDLDSSTFRSSPDAGSKPPFRNACIYPKGSLIVPFTNNKSHSLSTHERPQQSSFSSPQPQPSYPSVCISRPRWSRRLHCKSSLLPFLPRNHPFRCLCHHPRPIPKILHSSSPPSPRSYQKPPPPICRPLRPGILRPGPS